MSDALKNVENAAVRQERRKAAKKARDEKFERKLNNANAELEAQHN
jgi:hypothetical protein